MFNLSRGGLAWHGGFFLAICCLLLYFKKKGINFWTATDLITPYIALAQAFGRIGCFLNGCCYGIEVCPGYPFAVTFPGESVLRQPVQIYSSISLFAIFVILRLWQDKRHFKGEIAIGYCILYSLKRFFIEFLRADNPRLILNLTLAQYISIIVFIAAAVLFIYRAIAWKKNPTDSK